MRLPLMVLALLLATPAAAQSLTGAYSGVVACDRTEEGRPGVFRLELDIRVLHEGETLHIATWTAEDESLQRRKPSLYTGGAKTADGRLSGWARSCRPDFEYHELIRILPALPSKDGPLSFVADTIFVTEALPGAEGRLITETCRWVMEQTSAETPEMETCGAD